MAKFMVLYRSPTPATEMMTQMTEEQRKAGMDMWMAWSEKVGTALADFGMPLGESRSVGSDSRDSQVTGYSILEAGSLEEATKLVNDHPHLKTPGGATIDVYEFLPMPGM
jgi:hypothetical protein